MAFSNEIAIMVAKIARSRFWMSILVVTSLAYFTILIEKGLGNLMLSSETNLSTSFVVSTSTSSCPAQDKGYQSVFCPVWPQEKLNPDRRAYIPSKELPPEIDPHIRYLYAKQNPPDCSTANYYLREHFKVGK